MKIILKRGQIGKAHGIDVTVKSATGWACVFTPTWEMVSGHKGGTMGDIEYSELYTEILVLAGEKAFQKLWQAGKENGGKLTVQCYCPSGKFCHTHLLIGYAVKHYPQWFSDGRHTQRQTKAKGGKMKYMLAVDLETTGLKSNFHEITQIAAILMDKSLNELGTFETLVHIDFPERGIDRSFNVFEYTGIKVEDLQKAPLLKEALRALETFVRSKINDMELKKVILFGQNPTFDKGFLEQAYISQGWTYPFDFHVFALESMYAYHHLLKTGELPGDIGLKDICKVAGIENKQKHNAMSDIRATVDSLHKLCSKIFLKPTKESSEEITDNKVPLPVPRRRNVRGK
jgi:DNA polymerase III epsilon subunit-like protein